jgi:DHA1 family tetracycline resistance protein-like MFS transporter
MSSENTVSPAGDERRALIVLLGVIFLNIAGFGLVIPLLPFFGQTFQAQAWQITLMFSAFSLGQFIGEPIWGRLSDRIGRKRVLMITIAGMALSYVALAFSPNVWIACLARLAGGLLGGNISTLQGAIADITPPHLRAARMGLMGAAFSAGFMTGPALGGFLAQPQLGTLGFQLPLFVAAGLGLASSLAVIVFVREHKKPRIDHPHISQAGRLREAFAHPVISRVVMISFVVMAGFAGVEATYGLFTSHNFGWGPRQVALVFTGIGALGAFCQAIVTGRVVRRFGETRVLTAGLVSMGVGMMIQFVLSTWWPATVIGFAFICIGQSLTFPNISALISHSAPPHRQGEMLGLNMGGMALARIGGPVLAGQMFSWFSPAAPFLFTAIMILPALYFATQIRHRVPDPA